MNDREQFVNEILAALGGEKNVLTMTHCATRLRFSLRDNTKLDLDTLEANSKILGVVAKNGNYQLIIGTNVAQVYKEIIDITGPFSSQATEASDQDQSEPKSKGNILDRFLSTISSIFTPYIPVLATSGIILGLIALAENFGWLAENSPTSITLNATGNALLFFFPILLAFTAASRFGANPYIGATIGAALMHPDLSAILVSGEKLDFLGIPYIAMNFGNTVIPIVIAIWAFSYLEKGLKKYLPRPLQFTLVPFLSLSIMVPLCLLVFGPIGNMLATGIANIYLFFVEGNVLLLSLFFGAFFIFVIMLGLHWVILPIQLQILSEQGFEYSLAAGGMGGYALLGISLAVLVFNKDKKLKEVAGSSAFVNLISGITEPALYGICLKSKHYFISLILGGAAGGLVCGLFQVYVKAFAFGGILGLPAFAAATEVFPFYLLSVFSSIAVGFIVTFLIEKSRKKRSIT